MPLIDNPVQAEGRGALPVAGSVLNAIGGDGYSMPEANWTRLRRPYLDQRGRACVTIRDLQGGYTRNDSRGGEAKPLLRNYLINDLRNQGFQLPPVCNAATLTKQQWVQLDTQVVKSYRQRLRAVADLEGAGLTYGGFNAMGRFTLEYQAVSDPGVAVVDLDATTDATADTPLSILRSLPLPITHSDFSYSDRHLQVSRSGPIPLPLDNFMGECAARRVAEMDEDHVIGNITGITYGTVASGVVAHTGTSTVYGYRNFAQRIVKNNFTAPTGTNPDTVLSDWAQALEILRSQFSYGPWVVYHSTDYSRYLDLDYYVGTSAQGLASPTGTLRDRLLKLDGIADIRRLDRLTATFTLIFVQMTSEVVQLVNGMDVTTIQWQEKGGLEHRWKVMTMKVPRLRSDYSSRTGILHGTTA